MRSLPLLLLSTVAAIGQPTAPAPMPSGPSTPASRRMISPEISADRRVTIRLRAPNAKEVTMKCEFDPGKPEAKKDREGSWEVPLAKDEQGIWNITVGPIAPEVYHYSFQVDGVRTIDVSNPNVKTGAVGSTLASSLEVHGDQPAFYDVQPVPHGDVRTNWYESKSLGTIRRVNVYLPPDYERDARRRYPVVYLLHGANADETAWTRLGRAHAIMDNLIAENKTAPFIIVMPFGYGTDPNRGSGENASRANFDRDLLEDLIPFIDAKYHTQADRGHRALIGLSMGGGQAFNIGLNNLDRFSYVAGFCAGIGRPAGYPTTYANLVANAEAANRQLKLLWIGCSVDDTTHMGDARAFVDFLNQHGIKHTFHDSPGGHTWIVWREYLRDVAPMLFR